MRQLASSTARYVSFGDLRSVALVSHSGAAFSIVSIALTFPPWLASEGRKQACLPAGGKGRAWPTGRWLDDARSLRPIDVCGRIEYPDGRRDSEKLPVDDMGVALRPPL